MDFHESHNNYEIVLAVNTSVQPSEGEFCRLKVKNDRKTLGLQIDAAALIQNGSTAH